MRRSSTISNKNGDAAGGSVSGSTSSDDKHSGVLKTLKDVRELVKKDLPLILDPQMISGVLDAVGNLNNLDDRKMLLEHVLMLMANTPPDTQLATKLQNAVVTLLYNDLTHPPPTYVSNEYQWRRADGSHNNVSIPDMGKAGTPYARSVQQIHPLPGHMLPDAGLVFDTLLKREKFVKHPAGLSSLMFSFAALVIHTCFRTSHRDWTINETSSYVDLSPLYGVDQASQDKVRARDGRGMLHPDVFAEDRLLLLPPAVCVLLVLFSRNHNFIASKLLDINERGIWVDPNTIPQDDPKRTAKLAKQDEEIFQTARLINCGWFANVVFSDYFSAILGFVRKGISWSLNPFEEIRKEDHTFVERGQGNAVSVEFNCLYRWHATTSVEDEQWVSQAFKQFFGDKNPEEVTPRDFQVAAAKAQQLQPDCEHWTFGGLKRQEDGRFADADLARILQDATTHHAASFGARGTPAIMKLNEIMGIEQSRRWGICSLNDFRKFLGLKPYSSFLEWNPDPEIAEAASRLYYGDINNLELYVGLQGEETKPVVDGAGLCPGYTISRAILADAISLTRGDRFYTTDMTPYNYTAWGLKDCQKDTSNPGYGSMLGRLFLRHLPSHYTSDSAFTWFPLMTPEAMEKYTKQMGVRERYNFDRPTQAPVTHIISDYASVAGMLKDVSGFRPPYADRVGAMVKGQGFFITFDQNEEGLIDQKDVYNILIGPQGSLEGVVKHFQEKARYVIERDSYFLAGKKTKNVDISTVLKMIPIHWVASEIAGITLKSAENPDGEWTDEELFTMLGTLYDYIFLETEPEKELNTEDRARKYMNKIHDVVKTNLRAVSGSRLSFIGFLGSVFAGPKKPSHEFLQKMVATGKPLDELANAIVSVAIVATVELSQAMINMVNLYLDAPQRSHIESAGENVDILAAFAREAMRIDPPFAGVYREALSDKHLGQLSVKTNERLFLSIAKANRSPNVFPNPTEVDVTRSADLYLAGDGISRSFGNTFVHSVMGAALKTIFALPNLRRSPGVSGTLKRFRYNANGTEYYQYLDKNMDPTAWATSLILQYDA
ncbi:linoleate diol synthase [Fomitiporia mediterranea MF3/22]|uniref:linoleate diol synthase n=1 Tax=Fomitiporia mediterranea (strain MF3/22) TaxID=694068 RepID=UPI000440756C|nr:linoleate diol synthase [Fomitiporia mediterranea MF3/22]EJD07240.1 linoleate diol synthase [Fomitiporia mediterranea MF3/22]